MNYYWQPCGVLDSNAPSQCQGYAFAHSGACRIQMFTQEVVSIGDWSAEGQVRWRSIVPGDVEQFPTRTGAVVEFQSLLSNCTSASGALEPFSTSIALVCDEDGLYDLHGPLDFEVDVPCAYKMSMLTKLACAHDQPHHRHSKRKY
jgi:hypothetical protein